MRPPEGGRNASGTRNIQFIYFTSLLPFNIVCVMPLANLLLLFIRHVTNLFWSRRHCCCAAEAIGEALLLVLCLNELLNTNPGFFAILMAPLKFDQLVMYDKFVFCVY